MHERHGQTKTRLYRIWRGMIGRCYDRNHDNYPLYGGRGISMCEEWRTSFVYFSDWAMASGYKSNLSIDRLDNDKGYSAANCRWATPKQQSRNRRPEVCGVVVEHQGKRKNLSDWARCTGIKYTTLVKRYKNGTRGAELFKQTRMYRDKFVQAVLETRNGKAKLTRQQVEEIRISKDSGVNLARRFGVSESAVSMIRRGIRRTI